MTDKQLIRMFVVLVILAGIAGCGERHPPDQATGDFGIVGGGVGNEASGEYATVCGGSHNTASAYHATVGGGSYNTASVQYSAVGGGANNIASATRATVGGGYNNIASHLDATVSGGGANTASGTHATVGGGSYNTARGLDTTVGGGSYNTARGTHATVCGGTRNIATGFDATVGGGAGSEASEAYATIGRGLANHATGIYATVGGGYGNASGGSYSTVPGGFRNEAAGDYSFASGRRAIVTAAHDGAFLYADSNDFDFYSTTADEFAVRATGGVRLVTAIDGSGDPVAGVELPSGSGSWSSLSDRETKANVSPVDENQILLLLAELPISTWNYTGQDPSIRHIGPMAQDFHAAFGVGEDDKHISTVDAGGVALAAIQGLYRLMQEKETQITALQGQIAALETRVAALEQTNKADSSSARPFSPGTPTNCGIFLGLCLAGVVLRRSISPDKRV